MNSKNSMMKRRNYISGLITILFLLHTSLALNFTLDVSYPTKIIAGEKGVGYAKITNYDEDSFFTLSVSGPRPEWITFEKLAVFVKKGESRSVKIYIKPNEDTYEALYKFNIKAVAKDSSSEEAPFPIKVEQIEKLRISNITVSCENNICSPGEKVRFSVNIINLGKEERTLILKFVLDNKKIEHKIIVEGRKKKGATAEFSLERYQPPGEYEVKLEVYEAGEKILEKSASFSVKKVEKVEKSEKENTGFFSREVMINVKNYGNTEKEYTVSSKASEGMLILYSGKEAMKTDGKYIWKITLKPGESVTITYREIFLYKILIIIAVVAVIVYLKFFYVWGIKIRKNLIYKAPVKEGDKISVSIEVSASKPVKKIVVRDFVPPNFELVKSFETVKPMRKEKEDGIELVWKIRALKPGEERVLHYKLKSKIGIIGSISLPPATVECEIDEKQAKKKSNSPKIAGISEQ